MHSYKNLIDLHNENKFSIVCIDAIPRSMSTVLEIALAEIADLQLNEVFNRGMSDLEHSSQTLHELIEPFLRETSEGVKVISKNIASEIGTNNFKQWIKLSEVVVFTIREPILQTVSLIERVGNDKLHRRGSDKMKFSELKKLGDKIDKIFLNYKFKRNSWEDLNEHVSWVSTTKIPYFIVDGTLLTKIPNYCIKHLAKSIGRRFVKKAVDNWSKAARENFINVNHYERDYDPERISTNAWVREANASTSFKEDKKTLIKLEDLENFFPSIADYVEEIAYPIYIKLVRENGFMIDGKTLSQYKNRQKNQKSNGLQAVDIIGSLRSSDPWFYKEIQQQDPLLYKLLKKYG